MRPPLVTVLMPVHNAMPYLPEAVASVLGQTCCDLRLVVVDDCSTDGSAACLEKLARPNISVIRLQKNFGQGAARNAGLAL